MSGNGQAMGSRAKRVTLAVALWLALTIACAAPVLIFTRGLPAHILAPGNHAPAPGMSTPAPAPLPRSPGATPGHARSTPGAGSTPGSTPPRTGAPTLGAPSSYSRPSGSQPAHSSPGPGPQPSPAPRPSPGPTPRPSPHHPLPVIGVTTGPSGICVRVLLGVCASIRIGGTGD